MEKERGDRREVVCLIYIGAVGARREAMGKRRERREREREEEEEDGTVLDGW